MGSFDASVETLERARALLTAGDVREALRLVGEAKARRPLWAEADALRARCFFAMNDRAGAEQAAREALRDDPGHAGAGEILARVCADPWTGQNPLIDRVRAATMCGPARLANLERLVCIAAQERIAGSIVECGVAGGGSLALLALVAAREGLSDRHIYGCDTFCGMPEPGAGDTAGGRAASETGWGAGTCAASPEAVRRVLTDLGVGDRVRFVEGRFEETLGPFAQELAARGERIAVLHADGDWVSSTRAILENLTPLLGPGSLVQIDDYGHWDGCRAAVDEFMARSGRRVELHPIDYTGRWLRWPG